MIVELTGRSIIGSNQGKGGGDFFHAANPVSGQPIEPRFASATTEDIESAARLAHEAFSNYGRLSGREKGKFLRKIASNLEAIATAVIDRPETETALPQ